MKKNFIKSFIVAVAIAGLGLALAFSFVAFAGPKPTQAQVSGVDVKSERVVINIASGTTGSGSTKTVVQGRILRVDLDYGTGLTSATQLTITQQNELVANNIVVNSGSSTDASFYPRVQVQENDGTALTYDGTYKVTDYYPATDILDINLGASEAATPAVTVEIYWLE